MKKCFAVVTALALFAILFTVGVNTASAAGPETAVVPRMVGQWNVTFYFEPNLSAGKTQGICFKEDGTWYSTTFVSWVGDWFEKGDSVRWYGHTIEFGTSEFGAFIRNKLLGGQFAHFRFTGNAPVTSSKGNWVASKVNPVCDPPATSMTEAWQTGDPAR
jgi:hypothetical protein